MKYYQDNISRANNKIKYKIGYKVNICNIKNLLSIFIISALLFTSGVSPIISFALAELGADIKVDKIQFVREHDGINTVGAYVEIFGEGLYGKTVFFERTGLNGGYDVIGKITSSSSDTFLKYIFTPEEARILSGKMRIGTTEIDLDLEQFPNISGFDKKNINVTKYGLTPTADAAQLIIHGNNLDALNIPNGDIKADYGRVAMRPIGSGLSYVTFENGDIRLVEPPAPDIKGSQNITFKKDKEIITSNGGKYKTSVKYLYANAFRFIEGLKLTNLSMFPNTGSKGDYINIMANNFSDAKDYDVYFLKTLDGSDRFTDKNKAEHVSLELGKTPNDLDRLIVKVPNNPDFELRSYFVVLTNSLNGEIIAEEVIKDADNNFAEYTVIGSGYQPKIERIFPEKGSDTGDNVQIAGRNLLTLNLPNLTGNADFKKVEIPQINPSGRQDDGLLFIEYENNDKTDVKGELKYRDKPVTVTRTIKMQIGKPVKFVKGSDGRFLVNKGIPDKISVRTDVIDDVELEPIKDVVIEIRTIITEKDSNTGLPTDKKYIFDQVVTDKKAYEFIPSTIVPLIDKVSPDIIQIEKFGIKDENNQDIPFNIFTKPMLISITGHKFLVNREVNSDGEVITKYPTVLIKKDGNNTYINQYQLGFFPNEIDPITGVRGVIKYKVDEDGANEYILRENNNPNGKPISLEMFVVDKNNGVVNGTRNNEVGSKIILKVPNVSLIKDTGIKSIQVTNPRRKSDSLGASTVLSDIMSFIRTSDVPVVEKVEPNIVTVDGGVEVVVTGSNFQDGVQIYLDGEKISDYKREIGADGEKIMLKFQAPEGRVGTTQLQIINPDGGLSVKDFIYVTTFAKDPVLEDFNPKKGTEDTLLVLEGDNFLRPDPTVASDKGYDAFRLIGTRVFLDNKDINKYQYDSLGNIKFSPYISPKNENVIRVEASQAMYSPFYKNAYAVKLDSNLNNDIGGQLFYLEYDAHKNPRLTNRRTEWYDLRRNDNDSAYEVYDINNQLMGQAQIDYNNATSTTNIKIPSPSGNIHFKVVMDNKLLHPHPSSAGIFVAKISDYTDSIILSPINSSEPNYYILRKNLHDELKLSNGREDIYTIKWDNANHKFIAQKSGAVDQDVTLSEDGKTLTIGADKVLEFLTPYVVDGNTGAIIGDRTDVISKNQIVIKVPYIDSGKGYKDVKIVNPDTKFSQKIDKEGFYYITQPSGKPIITRVDPARGSVDGGYVTNIYGLGFKEGIQVYIDGKLIEQKDQYLSIDGSKITVKVPKYKRDLPENYGVDSIDVSIVVVNQDGSSDYLSGGFKYIIPVGVPVIEQIRPAKGSSTGGDIVEILGYEFRFFEPYKDVVGKKGYDKGDPFEDLNVNGRWDDLLDVNAQTDKDGDGYVDCIKRVPTTETEHYQYILESAVLPTVYFGHKPAKILEFSNGYMKVLTPEHIEGVVDVTVANNDLGISNAVKYQFETSSPTIDRISPNTGRKQGIELKDIYGTGFYNVEVKGYKDDIDDVISPLENLQTLVRFGNIDNKNISREQPNSGLIFNQRTIVHLTENFTVLYNGVKDELALSIEENGTVYKRIFKNYKEEDVYIPLEMLKSDGKYYTPNGYKEADGSVYSGKVFEHIRIYVKDKRLLVERGYVPKSTYDNINHMTVITPSYYTVADVTVTIKNPDGGVATSDFQYTNPDSEPKILQIGPQKLSPDKSYWMVEGAMNGVIEIEIIGKDFRKEASVKVGDKVAEIKEVTKKTINNEEYDVLIVSVPQGSDADIGQKYPVLIENGDMGTSSSATLDNLIKPNYENKTLPFYFIYRKALSAPIVDSVSPNKTSVFGGHEIIIKGKDFREGAIVIIGTVGGVPITDGKIEDKGRTIRITTPKNMVIGQKAVIVQNKDFGQAILENGLQIVSYPVIDDVTADDNKHSGRISIEGGDVITIKGKNFQEGAKVVFDGVRKQYDKNKEQTGEIGLWKDDREYIIENGISAQNVQFIDENTLKVTSPSISKEDDIIITVINPDSGISDGENTIEYSEPVPSNPIGLRAKIVDDRYIKLYDYSAKNVEYYEVFYNISDARMVDLQRDDYSAFSYLLTTNKEPYKITNLPSFERAKKNDRIHFVIRAVNKFGPSKYSNIAVIPYNEFKDIKQIGDPDDDGGLSTTDTHKVTLSDGQPILELGTDNIPTKLSVDFSNKSFDTWENRLIHVPAKLINEGYHIIFVDYGDLQLQFSTRALNTSEFREVSQRDNSYGIISSAFMNNDYSQLLMGKIPRNKKAVSPVLKINFSAENNNINKNIHQIAAPINFAIPIMDQISAKNILYRYERDQWTPYDDVKTAFDNNRISSSTDLAGYFLILGDR